MLCIISCLIVCIVIKLYAKLMMVTTRFSVQLIFNNIVRALSSSTNQIYMSLFYISVINNK